MPDSLSQISLRGTLPSNCSSIHIPSSRSCVCRIGIIRPTMNRECAAVITMTGSSVFEPSSSGIFFGGTTDRAAPPSPGSHVSLSAGSTGLAQGAAVGRCRGTR